MTNAIVNIRISYGFIYQLPRLIGSAVTGKNTSGDSSKSPSACALRYLKKDEEIRSNTVSGERAVSGVVIVGASDPRK